MSRRVKILGPLAVVGVGALGAGLLLATAPPVETRAPERPAPLVRVLAVEPRDVRLSVTTHGTVAPRTESDLVAEVTGQLVWVAPSFASGGFFEEGEPLVRLDRRDYELARERARADLLRAESEHQRAIRELRRRERLAKEGVASPSQLDDATTAERVAAAALRQARAALDQAERDLARTELRAPYRGRVRERFADVGGFVARGTRVARLYAIDYVEIRLPVADHELAFLDLPLWYRDDAGDGEGPPVRLRARFAGGDHAWEGRVVRTEGEIDPRSRMVHVVARVDDPYGLPDAAEDRPPLAVGLFVEAEIGGRAEEGVFVVPRAALRGEDRLVVADAEDRLRFRQADVVRAGRDEVVVRSGLEPGDRVVVSTVEAAVDGMALRPVPAGEAGP